MNGKNYARELNISSKSIYFNEILQNLYKENNFLIKEFFFLQVVLNVGASQISQHVTLD